MSDHGTIFVRVYTSRAQIPVAGATVTLSQHSSQGEEHLLALAVTDRSGLVPAVTVSTPPLSASTEPEDILPYATCCVRVEHPSYQMLTIEQVQIFPNIETLQEVELIPLPEEPSQDDLSDTLVIPSNRL